MIYIHPIAALVFVDLVLLIHSQNLQIGDECTIARTGDPGICKFLSDCAEANNALRNDRILPTQCGYKGKRQIICCKTVVVSRARFEVESELPLAVKKCKKYSEYVNVTAYSWGQSHIIDRCGHSAVPLIVGGTAAAEREFPHSALLGTKQPYGSIVWYCGGSLVSTRYVLTAAHCLKPPNQSILNVTHVRLGELVLNDVTDDEQLIDIAIEQIIPHPTFRRIQSYNDIALIRLVEKVTLSPYIRPICLPTDNLDPPKSIAIGWGAVELAGANSSALLKVVLETYNHTYCQHLYRYNWNRRIGNGVRESQLCAGSKNDTRDTCQGDSGGPLQIYHSNMYCMYTQVGITSYGIGCGQVNFPGLYTRVYNYVQWIENIIWAPGEDD